MELLFFGDARIQENKTFEKVLEVVDLDLPALEVFQVRVVDKCLVY